jgi:hypothetical protein
MIFAILKKSYIKIGQYMKIISIHKLSYSFIFSIERVAIYVIQIFHKNFYIY